MTDGAHLEPPLWTIELTLIPSTAVTNPVTVKVVDLTRMSGRGKLIGLAAVEIVLDGVAVVTQGWRLVRRGPCCSMQAGGWWPRDTGQLALYSSEKGSFTMEMDEYARAQSTRLGLQALLTALMQNPLTTHLATEAKSLALQMAAETDRRMPKDVVFEQQSEQVYTQLEDLFRPVTALQNRSRSK